MMPKVMKPAGYVTAQVGKWSQLPLGPGEWGFDEYLRFPASGRYWREQTTSYTLNGQQKDLPEGKYLPDIMHDFLVDFMTRHKDKPFYVHYAMSHIHGPIVRTPDTAPGTTDFYADNIAYMDKLIGKLMDALDRLKLREKTLIVFVGDNGTAQGWADRATIHGKRLSGEKGTMLEGGSRVPMIASWPGTTPAGKTSRDLVDFSDYFTTFAALAGAKLSAGVTIDGHSFAPQLKGQKGTPREWVYVELTGRWYVRGERYKLTRSGEMFDLKNAPFEEKPVPPDTKDPAAIAARKRLQAVLDRLNPAAGKQKPAGQAGLGSRRRQVRGGRKNQPPT
jgi:arylsulfatase A